MKRKIGIYEAKTSLSKLIKAVKTQKISFQISERGVPVALLCPIEESKTLDQHMAELQASGVLELPTENQVPQAISTAKGALKRFLQDRE